MPLQSATLTQAMTWQLSKTNPGFQKTKQGADGLNFSLSGLDVSVHNQIATGYLTIAAGAFVDVDLTVVTNLLGETFAFTSVLSLMALPVGGACTIGPGASNGIQFFGGTGQTVSPPDGGGLSFSYPATSAGVTVDSTHKILRFANGGATSLTVAYAIVGSS